MFNVTVFWNSLRQLLYELVYNLHFMVEVKVDRPLVNISLLEPSSGGYTTLYCSKMLNANIIASLA